MGYYFVNAGFNTAKCAGKRVFENCCWLYILSVINNKNNNEPAYYNYERKLIKNNKIKY